jgi:hypothetical protein
VSALAKVARHGALALLEAGDTHKNWTAYQRQQWTKAFNALQRLAGKKIVSRGGKLVTEG